MSRGSEGARPGRILARSSPFSYACAGCGRCCHDKRIALTPYEIARLAQARGTTTREILEHHTMESGTALLYSTVPGAEATTCTFLHDGRCVAHGGRPLACRLYPLGRSLNAEGVEAFLEVPPHPATEGLYGEDGTALSYISAQGALPFIEASRKTYALFERLIALTPHDAVVEALGTSEAVASEWLDVDLIVARVCERTGRLAPSDVEERFAIYLEELDRWIRGHGEPE